ncbi:MAG: S8 family serine peptidase [Dysgonamonadaceae bacterium]|jgi:subtilisin family serine protease|nr:S8 family serine peptidase [Dysgonamonadaceae bacterium]
MATVKGKVEMFRADLKHFKEQAGIGGWPLFERYPALATIVKNNIGARYQDFLSYPTKEGGKVTFHGKKYTETPRILPDLPNEEQSKYQTIKNETIAHYNSKIEMLRNAGKTPEADFLAEAIKHIDDRFVYGYDDSVVLGVWGMKLKENASVEDGVFRCHLRPGKTTTPPKEQDDTVERKEEPPISIVVIDPPEPPDLPPRPWWKRFWLWLTELWAGKGCLKWLLWLLLALLLLLLLLCLLRSCSHHSAGGGALGANDSAWLGNDPRRVSDGGGIYDPYHPYDPVPTPPEYSGVLPPSQNVIPPVDTAHIIRKPGEPVVVGNRLNILMENENKTIMQLAKDFKTKYPDNKYRVVYYDNTVKRMQIELPSEERERLKQEIPDAFSPDYELFVFDESLFESNYSPSDPAFADSEKTWYLQAIKAPEAWDITRGNAEIVVAIIDGGFNLAHPELKDRVVSPYNVWTHTDEVFPQKLDHGTHVAGIALAAMNNGKGLCGIAPECRFMPVQIADRQCVMTTTSVLDGVLFALYQGADVVNLSLGAQLTGLSEYPVEVQADLIRNHFKEEERLWREVMRIAANHNSTIVVAAGNDNVLAGITPIQRPEQTITVSAVNRNRQNIEKAEFSNYGPYSDISAPGVGIFSSIGKNNYAVHEGTSMAAPIISGSIALMKSLNDSLTTKQILCILQNTGWQTQDNIGQLIQLNKALEKVKSGEECIEPPSPCNSIVASGGDEGYVGSFEMGQQSGAFIFAYNTQNVPDKITLYDGVNTNGKVIFTYEGSTRTPLASNVQFHQPTITVEIIGGNETYWEFLINCPGQKFEIGNPQNSVPPYTNYSSADVRRSQLENERNRLQQELDNVNSELRKIENGR